jgi:uracil-DNA glycosylase family 4
MQTDPETRAALIAALQWQIELGADEAIGDAPVDRFAPPPPEPDVAPALAHAPPATAAPPPLAETGDADNAAALAEKCETLEALRDALAAFDAGELKAGARNCVFADGLPGARVMIVGEAPGREEDEQGKPFVGRAGKLLDRMLGAIGLDRAADDPLKAAYITNILPWRPIGNRTPSAEEAALFLPFVRRHIALAKPDFVVLMGGSSAKALMETTVGITRLRGRWTRIAPGVPALATFHPAYLLRSPAMKRHAWTDLLALRAALDGEAPPLD